MRTSVRLAIITLAQRITDLAKLDPDQIVEFDEWLGFVVKKPVRNIFYDWVNDAEIFKGDIIYFDYMNSHQGPKTRVGEVLDINLDIDKGYILLWDYTTDGIKKFNAQYIDDIHYLAEIDYKED
jgi:hypothetical protein